MTRTLLNPEYVLQGVDSILADLRSPLGYWLMVRLSHQQEMVTPSAYNSFRQEVMKNSGVCATSQDGVEPDSCTAELVAFLQRENARCPKDAEGAPEAVHS